MAGDIVGRERELEAVAGFLDATPSGARGMLVAGAPGIGKTTLWQGGLSLAEARSYRILATRPVESEARLSYAALGDLLGDTLDEVADRLPPPQRRALDVALLRAEGSGHGPDRRAVSIGTVGAIRALSADRPLLLAIDDIQWIDDPSARVLSFAVRRLVHEPVGVLVVLREGPGLVDPLELERTLGHRATRLSVGPFAIESLAKVVRPGAGGELSRPILLRIHEASRGNPMFALELAREILRRGVPLGEALHVPRDLADLLRSRVEALPEATRDVLLVAASASRPTQRLVRSASGLGERADSALARAESSDVVRVEGETVRFVHPLLASAVYDSATTKERRRVHECLAKQVQDREERARHLALSSIAPDAQSASALDDAANRARARGAPDSAAELSELARRLTPPDDVDAALRRTVQAAEHHFDAGDAARSWDLFEEAIGEAQEGRDRARILYGLAAHSWMDMRRVQALCEQALQEAGHDADFLPGIHEHLAWVGIYQGNLDYASEHARASLGREQGISDAAMRADVLATFGMVEFLMGRPAQKFMLEGERFEDLGASENRGISPSVYTAARTNHGLQYLWAGELDAARDVLEHELREYEERGRYLVRDELLCYLAELECRAGHWDVAARHAREALEIDVESGRVLGRGHMLFPNALVAAHKGDVDGARSAANEGLTRCLQNNDLLDASCIRAVLGFLELSLSNHHAAKEHLEGAVGFLQTMGSPEPGVIPCFPDAIEVLVSLGELDAAESLLREHEAKGRALGRPWALATSGRCRGLLLAARGEVRSAVDVLEEALEQHERVPQPFDLARTKVVLGDVQRRAKQKRAARVSLQAALDIFEELGAPLWSVKARASLARISGRASQRGLTETERQIARLVVEGRTNREVAEALFVSVKTVEANLSRIYDKLGIRSRRDLRPELIETSDAL